MLSSRVNTLRSPSLIRLLTRSMASTSNRVVIVTGGNSGLGLRTSEILAEKGGYDIILACRSEQKALEAVTGIKNRCPEANVEYGILDIAEKRSIDEFSEWFLSKHSRLDVLVNNAGILRSEGPRMMSKDGFETTFGTNYLGAFLLTMKLLDKIQETAKTFGEARIVNISSGWHCAKSCNFSYVTDFKVGPLDLENLNLEKPGSYNWLQAYKNSKASLCLFTKSLARSLENTGVVVNSMCPGTIPTTAIFREFKDLNKSGNARTLDYGAEQIVNLVCEEKFGQISGIYYKNYNEAETSDEVKDVRLQNDLWMKTCEMLARNYEHVLKQ